VEKLMHSFVNGQSTANALNGFLASVDQPAKELLQADG
jgi:hypothetical protein